MICQVNEKYNKKINFDLNLYACDAKIIKLHI